MDESKKDKNKTTMTIGYRAPLEQREFLLMMKSKGYTITDIIRRAIDAYMEEYKNKNK